jgi:PAS domain S-box-containing protein
MSRASEQARLDTATVARYTIVERMEDGVVVVDAETRVVDVNPAAEEILDWTTTEVIGQPAAQALSAWPDLLGLLGKGGGGRTEMELRQGTECRTFDIRVSPLHDHDEQARGHVIVLRDITAGKKAARDLQDAKDAADAANQAKSEFMGVASHEMRTPITCIKGYADLLAKGTAGPVNDLQAEFLTTIRANADRIALLVSDLSDIARIETGRLRLELHSVALNEVVREALDGMRIHFDKKSQVLTVQLTEHLPCVQGDYDRLVQVLTNLLSNAHKFTPPGGHIKIVAERQQNGVQGETIHVAVEDDGIGIAPEEQDLVFERFYRSEDREASEVAGSGLGLSIAKNLVEMHGGRIWLESTLRGGTTVYFSLPVERESRSRERTAAA